tara:strand:+ start:243 stop:479 length:237 start_codon:yes stop_codon:yes gene_type:complete
MISGRSSQVLLLDTSWWWNNGGEDPVVDGVLGDPDEEDSDWHSVAGDVLCSVHGSFGGKLPESWEIHILIDFNYMKTS